MTAAQSGWGSQHAEPAMLLRKATACANLPCCSGKLLHVPKTLRCVHYILPYKVHSLTSSNPTVDDCHDLTIVVAATHSMQQPTQQSIIVQLW
jgi:hypothetical protein